jgi:hypothetical protein
MESDITKNCKLVLYDAKTSEIAANYFPIDRHANSPVDITCANGPFVLGDEYLYFFLQPVQRIELMEKEEQQASAKAVRLTISAIRPVFPANPIPSLSNAG